MPKSRGRKRKPHHTGPHQARSRLGRPQSFAEQQARAVGTFPMLQATDRAEARGDARAVLALIESDLRRGSVGFWRPERAQRLMQLVAFGALMPRWAISRWVLAQAAQSIHEGVRARAREALEVAIETRGGEETLVGVDPLDARAKVGDHDWVFRQVFLYELGGLQHFINRVAAPDLLAGADRIQAWALAPMGGFRFIAESPRTLLWRDLATGEEVTSVNLGTASLLEPGECAIGRLVEVEDGAMFESVPLFVPDDVATQVAEDPAGWVAALAAACRRDGPPDQQIGTGGHDFLLLTDVPIPFQIGWVQAGVDITGSVTTERSVGGAAQAAFVRAALEGTLAHDHFPGSPWPTVAAVLLNPPVFVDVVAALGPDDTPKLLRLADLLVPPASELCRQLARDVRGAA